MIVPRRSLAVELGVVCVTIAVLVSQPVLEATIFPTGTMSTLRRVAVLLTGQIAVFALGVYLLAMRPRVTAVHLAALALGSSFAAIAGAVLLQLMYTPPSIVSGWRAFAPPAERNQLGFRGQPIAYGADDYVVVLLGDSHVEAMGLPFDAMPERLLEARLDIPGRRTRVFSVGAGAYGTDQELLALEEYLAKYRADVVVLWQTPSNDIWNNVFNTNIASRNPKPTFWLDASGRLRGPSEALGQPLANSPIVFVALFQRAFGLPWRDKGWERSLPEPYSPLGHYDGPVRMEWQQRWQNNLGRMRDEELDTEKSHMAVMLTPRSRRMQYGLDLTHALMHFIEALVTGKRGQLVVLQTDTDVGAPDGEEVYVLNSKYYRVSKRQSRANWEYVNRGFDVKIVPVTVPDWRISPDDAHLNKRATEQVMIELANRLRSGIGRGRRPAD